MRCHGALINTPTVEYLALAGGSTELGGLILGDRGEKQARY